MFWVRLQTFWHSNDHERDGYDDNVDESHAPLARRPIGILGTELHEEPDHESDEHEETGGTTDRGNEFRQTVKLELERCALSVNAQR